MLEYVTLGKTGLCARMAGLGCLATYLVSGWNSRIRLARVNLQNRATEQGMLMILMRVN